MGINKSTELDFVAIEIAKEIAITIIVAAIVRKTLGKCWDYNSIKSLIEEVENPKLQEKVRKEVYFFLT
ncbi:MAG: hypothetical protein Q8O41_05390 [Candidatus Methanoperedens sp.]|nr:hypothetical protein [Candidatus Methanoperedens sp.]